MDINLKNRITDVIKISLRNKFRSHNPEPSTMPFHTRLLGKDRMALFSFIHSLNTNFGSAIFEPIAKEIASNFFTQAMTQQIAGNRISKDAHNEIQRIMDNLTTASSIPDRMLELERVRSVCQNGGFESVKLTKVDLKIISQNGTIYFIDIKTAKPNAGGFKEYKRTMLEWIAAALADNPELNVSPLIAIPYNPYHPKPYSRWTIRGMLDLEYELKVAEEFWDFLGGEGTYEYLLDIFERVGIELRAEIDDYFAKYI